MNLTDFMNQVRLVFLVHLKVEPFDAARWVSANQFALERLYYEGFQPAEAITELSGKHVTEVDMSKLDFKKVTGLY